MYTQKQIEYSDFILRTIKSEGGRIEKSHLYGILHDRYDYDIDADLQVKQLMITEKMIVQDGTWLFLSRYGKLAARVGLKRVERKIDWLERIKRNADIACIGAFLVALIDIIIRLL